MNVENIKKDFPLLENRNIAYLDSGATDRIWHQGALPGIRWC